MDRKYIYFKKNEKRKVTFVVKKKKQHPTLKKRSKTFNSLYG